MRKVGKKKCGAMLKNGNCNKLLKVEADHTDNRGRLYKFSLTNLNVLTKNLDGNTSIKRS